jgi:hypothetical protein
MITSEDQKKAIAAAAEAVGVSMDDFCRIIATGCNVISTARHALRARNLPEDTPVHVALILGDDLLADADDSGVVN